MSFSIASSQTLAVKSNLLLDAATVVNLGAEIPLGQRFSLSAEAYFPWWRLEKRNLTIQMLASMLEGRYWLGNRSTKAVLTGWNVGIYAGAGLYDFQLGGNGDGVQGEMFIMGGGSVGYAHTISQHLRLEYTLGFGFLMTDYRKYHWVENTSEGNIKVRDYPWEDKRFSGFLPTKAGVSLVWLFGRKIERRGHE